MLRTVIGRYLLFAVLGIEALLLPYFLSRDVYAEIEFYKFTALLVQFTLAGAGTGYVVSYLDKSTEKSNASRNLILGGFVHVVFVGVILFSFMPRTVVIISICAMLAILVESVVKVKERYLLALSFKPLLSFMLIVLIPVFLTKYISFDLYLFISFFCAITIYIVINSKDVGFHCENISLIKIYKNYIGYIKKGFLMNITTAMMFVFFYIDRATIKTLFPDYLPDYSFSFSIMQMTIVAITTFSYVNIVEFGKENIESVSLYIKVLAALKKCFYFFLILGSASILFSYFAEDFYGYDMLFETTLLMVLFFGLSNVLLSINSLYLYLGCIKVLSIMMLLSLMVSILLNYLNPFEIISGYYILLVKTYTVFAIFSIVSFLFIMKKLRSASELKAVN